MLKVGTVQELTDKIGSDLGSSEWLLVSQKMVDDFAQATQDNQWIHMDTEHTRKNSPFGGPIAHGYLTLSLASKMFGELIKIEKASMVVNYGVNRVRFANVVPVGSRLRMHGTFTHMRETRRGTIITVEGSIEILYA